MSLLAPLTGCDKYTSDKEIEFISLADVSEYVTASTANPNTMILIDPRSQTAFEEGHIPGARNLLLTRFDGEKGRDPRIEAYERVVVYGEDPASGVGRAVTKRMIAMSYSDVYFFAGGLKEWQEANLPLETGPSKPLPAVKGGNKRGRAR